MELEEAEEDAQARELKKRSKSKRVNVDCPEVVVEVYTPATGLSSTRLYINRGLLGRGGFAAVYDVQRLDDSQVFAAKAISKASLIKARSQQKLQSEISIHAALCHPNIVQFVQSFEDAANVYLLLERCNGCTIADLVKRQGPLAEHDAAVLLEQMLSALVYLHDRLIIHRDLKLSNLFMTDEGRVKLGDFGLACQLATPFERKTTVCGTPNFIAPEVLRSKNGHGLEADIWSLGVVLYTMLVGRPPFETPNVKMTYSRIRANAYCFPTENPVSAEATDLIRSMLRLQPERRPSLDQIRNHAFFARFRPSNRQTSMPQPQRSTAVHEHSPQRSALAEVANIAARPLPQAAMLAKQSSQGSAPQLSAMAGRQQDALLTQRGPSPHIAVPGRERPAFQNQNSPSQPSALSGRERNAFLWRQDPSDAALRDSAAKENQGQALPLHPGRMHEHGMPTGRQRACCESQAASLQVARASRGGQQVASPHEPAAGRGGNEPLVHHCSVAAGPVQTPSSGDRHSSARGGSSHAGPRSIQITAVVTANVTVTGQQRMPPINLTAQVSEGAASSCAQQPGGGSIDTLTADGHDEGAGLGRFWHSGHSRAGALPDSPGQQHRQQLLLQHCQQQQEPLAGHQRGVPSSRLQPSLAQQPQEPDARGQENDAHLANMPWSNALQPSLHSGACEHDSVTSLANLSAPRLLRLHHTPALSQKPAVKLCQPLPKAEQSAQRACAALDPPQEPHAQVSHMHSSVSSVLQPGPMAAACCRRDAQQAQHVQQAGHTSDALLRHQQPALGLGVPAVAARAGSGASACGSSQPDAQQPAPAQAPAQRAGADAVYASVNSPLQPAAAAHPDHHLMLQPAGPAGTQAGQHRHPSASTHGAAGLLSTQSGMHSARDAAASTPEAVRVVKYLDLSSRYGLGYLLSDGSYGVQFNDHTSLVMAESSSHYLYIVHPKTRGGDGARRHEELRVLRSTGQNQLPAALAKKVSLLHHFKAHMPSGGSSDQPADASAGAADPLALRYVKQWLQAGRAIVFRFSTRAVQVEFTDGSEILLSGSAHTVCYHAKGADSPAATYCLDKLPADGQLLKRLKYTRELLPQLVQGCRGLLAAAV